MHNPSRHPTKCDVFNDIKLFPTVYSRIYCRKFLKLSNQTSCYKSKCIRKHFDYKIFFVHMKENCFLGYLKIIHEELSDYTAVKAVPVNIRMCHHFPVHKLIFSPSGI